MCSHAGGVGDARRAELIRPETCGKAGAGSGKGFDAFLGNRAFIFCALLFGAWFSVTCLGILSSA